MREHDPRKEALKENYDYYSEWAENDSEEIDKKIKELPKGAPRTGMTGKYLKKKGNVGRIQLKNSYGVYKKQTYKEFIDM